MWPIKTLQGITFFLDKMIYKLAHVSFSLFCYISRATIVNEHLIETFTRRLYLIIGLVMLFVIAYNLLNYIINPDKISDKKAGAGTFIKDIIIALIIMTITPTLFTKLYGFQNTIIESGVISNIFLGNGGRKDSTTESMVSESAGYMIADMYSSFILPENDDFTALDCNSSRYNDNNINMNKYCNAYDKAVENGDLSGYEELINDNDNFRYWPILSTAAGLVLVFFMLSFCINLGKRAGKLSLLALIAPVPALLEIVPGKQGTRKRWIESLIKTYLEVFIFQAVIFMIIYLITLIPDVVTQLFATLPNTNIIMKGFTLILLVFGLLEFAKEAPKMISELLGLKDTGEIGKAAKRAIAMGGVTAGLAGSTVGRFARNYTGTEGNFGQKLASGVAGSVSGIGRTLWGARNVHDLKGAKALRTKVNSDVIGARVKRDTYAQLHEGQFIPFAHVQDAVKGASYKFKDFANDGYTAGNAQLKSFGEYKSIFDGTKIKKNEDARYTNYQKQLDETLVRANVDPDTFRKESKKWMKANSGKTISDYMYSSDGFINTFKDAIHVDPDTFREESEKWMKANSGKTILDYMSASDGFSNTFKDATQLDFKNVASMSEALSTRENALKVDKKNDLIKALANAQALVKMNPDIAKIAKTNKIDLISLKLDATSSNEDFVKVYDTLDELNKKVGEQTTKITAENAQKEYEKKLREAATKKDDKK